MKVKSLITNEYRKLYALVLVLVMCVSVVSVPYTAKAEEVNDVSSETSMIESDLMEVQSVEVSRFAVLKGRFMQRMSQQSNSEDEVTVTVNDRNWQLYRTTYIFDQMNAEEKALYNELEAICMDYAKNSDKDAIYLKDTSGNGSYYLPSVSVKDFDNDEYINVLQMFIYSNPQYYFTTSSYAISGDNLYLYCYPAFADGEERAQVTNSLFSTIDTWVENIKNSGDTKLEIEKAAHDMLCNKLSYDDDAVDQMNSGDYSGDAFYSQSIYSAITKHKSVCAGYSLTFELLMNALGIPAVTAYSDYHAWNKVYLDDGCWYAVDVTWDDYDNDSWIDYSFYNKSDESIKQSDDDLPVHVVKMAGYYPTAYNDYNEEAYLISDNSDSNDVNNETVNEDIVDDTSDNGNLVEEEISYIPEQDVVNDEQPEVVSNIEASDDSNTSTDIIDVVSLIEEIEDNIIDIISDTDEIEDGSDNVTDNNSISDTTIEVVLPKEDNVEQNDNTDQNIIDKETIIPIPVNSVESIESIDDVSDTSDMNIDNSYVEEEITINSAKISKVKAGLRKCKVTWKKVKDISGYEIQLSNTKNFKKVTRKIMVSKSSSSVTIKRLKKKTTYYVRMRTYNKINGKRITSDWSGVKKVTVK